MGPKVRAACWFVERTGGFAAIGSIPTPRRCCAARPAPASPLETAAPTRLRGPRWPPPHQPTDRATEAPTWHVLSREDALQRAGRRARQRADAASEAAERLARYGPNQFAEAKAEPRWQAFLRQYQDPMQIVLLVAGVISIYPVKQPGTGIVILLLTLLNAVLGLSQEGKAAAAVAALAKMMIVKARVRRDGALAQLPAEQLVPGDVVDDRGRRRRAGRRPRAGGGDAGGRRGGADRREPAGQQGRRAGRGARRPARRPHRHGLHEHERHARDRASSSSRRPGWRPRSATSPGCCSARTSPSRR